MGQQSNAGSPRFDHARLVAGAVPEQARVTACLHDVLERTDLTAGELPVRRGQSRVCSGFSPWIMALREQRALSCS